MTKKNGTKNSDKNSDTALVVPKHGRGALLTGGSPGNKGGPGRPPKEFSADLREILNSPKVRKAFLAIIEDPEHKQFTALWKSAAAYAYGQPPQKLKLETDAPQDRGEEIMARLVEALPNLVALIPAARLKMAEALHGAEDILEAEIIDDGD